VVVAVGVAVTTAPVLGVREELGVHVYVLAPPPVNVVLPPEQIVGEPAVAVKVGVGLTVTATVADEAAGQPAADVPVTV